MQNSVDTDPIAVVLEQSADYQLLNEAFKRAEAAASSDLRIAGRNELLVQLETARRRRLRFEMIFRMLYVRVRDEGMALQKKETDEKMAGVNGQEGNEDERSKGEKEDGGNEAGTSTVVIGMVTHATDGGAEMGGKIERAVVAMGYLELGKVAALRPLYDRGVVAGLLAELLDDEATRVPNLQAHFEEEVAVLGRVPALLLDYGWLLLTEDQRAEGRVFFEEIVQLLLAGAVEPLRPEPLRAAVDADILSELAAHLLQMRTVEGANELARQFELSAIGLFDELAQQRPADFLPALAGALQQMGTIYRNAKLYPESEHFYNRSIEIRRKLAQGFPALYEPQLASAIRSLSRLYYKREDLPRLEDALSYVVSIYERLVTETADVYEGELSSAYGSLATALYDNKNRRGARIVWEKARVLQERMVEADAVRYLPDLLDSLLGLGTIHDHYREWSNAELLYKQGLALREQYRSIHPGQYDTDIARLLRYLAITHQHSGEWLAAEGVLLEALPVYELLAEKNAEVYRSKLRDVLRMLDEGYRQMLGEQKMPGDGETLGDREKSGDGEILGDGEKLGGREKSGDGETLRDREMLGGADGAVDFVILLEKQLEIQRRLDRLNRVTYGAQLTHLLLRLASEYVDLDRVDEAIGLREEADRVLVSLTENGVLLGLPDPAENLFWLAILQEGRDGAVADGSYRRSAALYEVFMKGDPEAFVSKLANVLMYHGRFLQRLGQAEAGKERIDRAVQLMHAQSVDDFAGQVLGDIDGK